MTIFNMSTSKRHANIIGALCTRGNIIKYEQDNKIEVYHDSIALVHYGHRRRDPYRLELVDANAVDNPDILDHLYFIEPDFMIFHKNKCVWNKNETRVAGYPDLVVEVWSTGNTQPDREEKFLIYSNSDGKTEHWYIEQDSNEVKCFIGDKRINSQWLDRVLKTQTGLEFDLTRLALL